MQNKPTIGLQISNLHNTYTKNILSNVIETVKKRGANLIIYNGGPLFSKSGALNAYHAKKQRTDFYYTEEYQRNLIYRFIDENAIDALVTCTGTLCLDTSKDEYEDFFRDLSSIPIVSIGIPLNGIPSVIVDNKKGMRDQVDHFIECHGYCRIAFIRGPANNQEAEDRYQAYRESLTAHKIELDESLIAQGMFYLKSGYEAIRDLIESKHVKFDAVIAANDDMALGAMDYLHDIGLKVPVDVAVGGFDDKDFSSLNEIPITTVRQPFQLQSVTATEMAIDLAEGIKITENIILPTEFIPRASCGCFIRKDQNAFIYQLQEHSRMHVDQLLSNDQFEVWIRTKIDILTDKGFNGGKAIEDINQLMKWILLCIQNDDNEIKLFNYINELIVKYYQKGIDVNYWITLLCDFQPKLLDSLITEDLLANYDKLFKKLIRFLVEKALIYQGKDFFKTTENTLTQIINIIQSVSFKLDLKSLLEMLAEQMPKLGFTGGFISLYDKPWNHTIDESWVFPENIRLKMAYNQNGLHMIASYIPESPLHEVVRKDLFSDPDNFIVVADILYFAEEQLGIMLTEIVSDQGMIYELLRVQISSAIKGSLLLEEQKQNRQILEQMNQELSSLSIHDELTGLYNRRGFLTLGEKEYQKAVYNKQDVILIFIDLDGLKIINDTFGHKEGDFAIKTAAEIIRASFRGTDIMARLGGDEFTVLVINQVKDYENEIRKRIALHFETVRDNINKPYEISFSMGFAHVSEEGAVSFLELMKRADAALYKEKMGKKNHR